MGRSYSNEQINLRQNQITIRNKMIKLSTELYSTNIHQCILQNFRNKLFWTQTRTPTKASN